MNWSAYLLPGVLIVIGASIYNFGSGYPQYSDTTSETQLNDPRWFERNDRESAVHEWFALRESFLTPRDHFHDLGLAIVLLGVSVATLFFLHRVDGFSGIGRMQTPTSHRSFYALAIITWLSFIPATWCYYVYTDSRGDYSPLADVIAIPAGGALLFGVFLLPVVVFGVWATTRGRVLPQPIWSRTTWFHVGSLGIAVWLALILGVMVLAFGITAQPPIVPSAFFTIYLLLSGKAAVASARQRAG